MSKPIVSQVISRNHVEERRAFLAMTVSLAAACGAVVCGDTDTATIAERFARLRELNAEDAGNISRLIDALIVSHQGGPR